MMVVFNHFDWLVFMRIVFIILIMSFPILLWSFKVIPYLLVRFWRLWLFNYPLSFTLNFPILNPMYWHETKGFPSLGVIIIHVQYFISIQCGNPKLLAFQCRYQIWSLMGERVNGPRMNFTVSNKYLTDSWATLHLHPCILTQNFKHFSLICPIFLWRMKGELVCESSNTKFSTKMDLTTYQRKVFIQNQKFKWITLPLHFKNLFSDLFSYFFISTGSISHPTSSLLHRTLHETFKLILVYIPLIIQNLWKWLHFVSKHFSWWFNIQNSTCAFMH